jgi:hypothetical protein
LYNPEEIPVILSYYPGDVALEADSGWSGSAQCDNIKKGGK